MTIREFLTKKIFPFLKFAKNEIMENELHYKWIFLHGVYLEDENVPGIMEFTIILN